MQCRHSESGFTLTEALIVVLIIGILSAITVASWLTLLNLLRLNAAEDQVYLAMREAQTNAKRDKKTWQASFRQEIVNSENVVQWAVHLASTDPTAAIWHNLDVNIQLDDETTLQKFAGISRVQFDYRGYVILNPSQNLGLGRLTLSVSDGSSTKRCVFVSTYLGTLRNGQNHPHPKLDSGKFYYCY